MSFISPGDIYALQFVAGAAAGLSPVDATTYYWASHSHNPTTTASVYAVRVPKTGTIIAAYTRIIVGGTLGSNETSNIGLQVNNGAATTIHTGVLYTAITQDYANSGLSISVAAGDNLNITTTTPTWATNPTIVYYLHTILIKVP